MTNTLLDFHNYEDNNEYVFVEFDEDMDIDEDSYDCCEDEELSFLSQTPSCSVSVCTENMFVDETSLIQNETNKASVVSLEEEHEGNSLNKEENLSDIESVIETLCNEDEDTKMSDIVETKIENETEKNQGASKQVTVENNRMTVTETINQSDVQMDTPHKPSREKSKKKSQDAPAVTKKAEGGVSRPSNKKRRKKLKEQKKKAAAANAALALAKMRSRETQPINPIPEQHKNKASGKEKKCRKSVTSSKLSVACATNTLAAFREQQSSLNKATRKINYVALI